MPKSFLFTHKRYDYDEPVTAPSAASVTTAPVEVKVEEDYDLQDLSRPRAHLVSNKKSGFTSASASSSGYSEDESFSPLSTEGTTLIIPHRQQEPQRKASAKMKDYYPLSSPYNHYPVAPKKRKLPLPSSQQLSSSTVPISWKDVVSYNCEVPPAPPQFHFKKEAPSSTGLNSSFKSLAVSTSPTSRGSLILEKKPHEIPNTHNRKNDIQFYHHHSSSSSSSTTSSPSMSPHAKQVIHAPLPQHLLSTGSYQIKLISPPPGGTLSQSNYSRYKDHHDHQMKMETMTSSPLQFIIAAAEHQEQAEEEERIFIEGSRSEESQRQQYRHYQQLESQPTNQLIHQQEEQPVNLSVKKVDLFNLTQLAEVSIAAAKREMSLRSSNVSNTTGGCPSASSSPRETGAIGGGNISLVNNSFKPIPHSNNPAANNNNLMTMSQKQSTANNENLMSLVKAKNVKISRPGNSGISGGGNNNSVIATHPVHKKKTDNKKQNHCKDDFAGKMAVTRKDNKSSKVQQLATMTLPTAPLLASSAALSNSATSNSSASSSTSSSSTSSSSCSSSARHRCVECGKGFSTLSNLARHRQTHRSLSDASAVKKCPHCDKVYVSMPAFSMHLRTHNQGCKCPYCGKGFSRPWLLQGHIRTHTGEKPFKCGICSKAFADKSNLRAHTQTHSTEKPFVCARCGKPFALKSYLCKHIESSCMKSNRPSGPSATSASVSPIHSGTSNGGVTPRAKNHGAINNSSVSTSPVSTGGTSPVMSTSSASPTYRDTRSASGSSTTTTVIATATSPTSSMITSNKTVVTKTTTAATILSTPSGFSSHNNQNGRSSNSSESCKPASLKAYGNNNNAVSKNNNANPASNASKNNGRIVSASTFFLTSSPNDNGSGASNKHGNNNNSKSACHRASAGNNNSSKIAKPELLDTPA